MTVVEAVITIINYFALYALVVFVMLAQNAKQKNGSDFEENEDKNE